MSERRENNTIFLMFLASDNYIKRYQMTTKQFLEMDEKYAVLNYIAECPDIFDGLTDEEMVEEIDAYVSGV